MKIARLSFVAVGVTVALFAASCNKQECAECHYDDGQGNEVELGERCGEDLEALEANGHTVDGVHYEAHCHGH